MIGLDGGLVDELVRVRIADLAEVLLALGLPDRVAGGEERVADPAEEGRSNSPGMTYFEKRSVGGTFCTFMVMPTALSCSWTTGTTASLVFEPSL